MSDPRDLADTRSAGEPPAAVVTAPAESAATATATAPPVPIPGAPPAGTVRHALFGRRWPGPSEPASRRPLLASAAVGIVAAAAVPLEGPGVGWLLTAFAITVAAVVVGRDAPDRQPITPATAGWAVLALALVAVSTVRAADWLAALCLLAAAAAGSLAVAGPAVPGVVLGVLTLPIAALRALPWVGRGLVRAGSRNDRPALRIAASVLVGLVLLLVFVPLLASADAAFGRVVDDLLPTVDVSSRVRWAFLFAFFGAAPAGVCFAVVAPPVRAEPPAENASRLGRVEWSLPVGLLVVVFAVFVGVQFAALFGGDGYVRRTTGLTYAEYARQGFAQLLLVAALTLVVIVVASRWAPVRTRSGRAWTRGLLGALTALSLVIVGSALNRLWVYQQAYGFTLLRLLVLTCELWLGVCFVLAMVAVQRLHSRGLVRAVAATGLVALLALAVLGPDRFVAERNVDRFVATGKIDVDHLAVLSPDAVPALVRLPEPMQSCALAAIGKRLGPVEDEDWRSWVAGRAEARRILVELRPICRP